MYSYIVNSVRQPHRFRQTVAFFHFLLIRKSDTTIFLNSRIIKNAASYAVCAYPAGFQNLVLVDFAMNLFPIPNPYL